MPRYFIDTDDGDVNVRDEEGSDLSGPHAARLIALDALPDMARQKMPDGDRRTFTVGVRDAAGAVVYTATLDLRGDWPAGLPLA